MKQMTPAAVERAMKLQEVMLLCQTSARCISQHHCIASQLRQAMLLLKHSSGFCQKGFKDTSAVLVDGSEYGTDFSAEAFGEK